MRVLELPEGATPREWGRIHGETFRGEVKAVCAIRTWLCTRAGGRGGFYDKAAVLAAAEAHLPVLARYHGGLHDELLGIAEGAAVSPAEVVVANHYTDLRDLDPSVHQWPAAPEGDGGEDPGGCSVVWGETRTGRILAQTWDMHATAIPYVMGLYVPESEQGPEAWLLTVTGCLGMAGINGSRARTSIAINNLHSRDATLGVVWPAMVRRALQQTSATAARDVVMKSPIGSGHHYFVADRQRAFAIETSGRLRKVVMESGPDGGARQYVHTNHCLDGEVAGCSTVPAGSTTHDRYDWLARSVESAELRDLPDAWERLGSTEGWPRSVCTNMATPENPHGAATCGAIAMNLDTGEVWMQGGFISHVRAERFRLVPLPSEPVPAGEFPAVSEYPFFFTWTAQKSAKPVEMTGGEGAWYFTSDGGRWLDLGALSYQVNAGHGNRRIAEAIKRQADQLCVASPSTIFPAKVELAERLLAMAPPGFSKVFFTLGGAESNENAIKMARLVTGRHKLISRYRSYHGATMGALSLTGDWRRPPLEPGIPGVVHVQDCYCDRCPFGQRVETCKRECATNIDQVMQLEGRGTTAAVFLEPVPGANGVLVPPPEYWPIVREACDRDGALLVADEVLTGFGRTGKPFGFQHWDVVPDIITVAKGLASGYAPIGAVLVHERVARHFDERILACGLTYYAHPIGCAAAVETLKVYEDEGMYGNAERLGPVLRREVEAVAARIAPSGFRTFVRGLGLLVGLEVEAPVERWQVLGRELAARRISLHVDGGRGTAIFSPPLCIGEDELVTGVRGFADAAVIAFGGA